MRLVRDRGIGPNSIQMLGMYFLCLLAKLYPSILQKLKTAQEIISYQHLIRRLNPNSQFFIKRESLWKYLTRNSTGNNLTIIELGVSSGYIAKWFLKDKRFYNKLHFLNQKNIQHLQIEYHGFDSFNGLPMTWRNYPIGSFSTLGRIPNIDAPRAYFYRGLVEETIKSLNIERLKSSQKLIIFDLDLYEPSLYSYKYIKESLQAGDILYFDQAFDQNEQLIITENVIVDFDTKILANTSLSIAIQILSPKY